MYFSDDSLETTNSQDERIAQALQQEKQKEKSMQALLDSERKEEFEKAFDEESMIFDLPGLTFLKFTHKKIKFVFEPYKVATLVNKTVKFYCSLKYYEKYQIWNIRHDSFPVNYKSRIYSVFSKGGEFSVDDSLVKDAILRVYNQLKTWAAKEDVFRQEKLLKYKSGKNIILDSDDEVLFLTKDEITELHKKRNRVLKRMIPPPDAKFRELPPETPKRKRRHQLSDSD